MSRAQGPADTAFISAFTPSQTKSEHLEAIFVQRHALLEDVLERVEESALGNKHHLLFVGPRGSGKTHLVTLLVHRLDQRPELAKNLSVAWLNEDETSTTVPEFLLRIHRALAERYPHSYNTADVEPVYDRGLDEAQAFVADVLLETVRRENRTILVVVENLDALFEGLGEEGQKKLRALVQEHPRFAIVGTAQHLSDYFKKRDHPFFGFFQVTNLKPLSEEEAAKLLGKISLLNGRPAVAEFLQTAKGRARVRALHYLSGGNHRVYIILSQFITQDSIDALVPPFVKMVDELTPYYQERLRSLPAQQRKIVEFLSTSVSTVSVKEIARRLFATPQTISSQLKDLRDKGYVTSAQRGRESLYEVAEPLMRICVEVKENGSHRPLALLVDFVRAWYDQGDLNRRLADPRVSDTARHYLLAALEKNAAQEPNASRTFKEGQVYAPRAADPLVWEELGEAAAAYVAIDQESAPVDTAVQVLFSRGAHHIQSGEMPKAVADFTSIIELENAPVEEVARAFINRGVAYSQGGETKKAIADFTSTIHLKDVPAETAVRAFGNRGAVHSQNGDIQKAIADFTSVVHLKGAPVENVVRALLDRGAAYMQSGEAEKAVTDFSSVVGLEGAPVDEVARALNNRGFIYTENGEVQKAIADFTSAIHLEGASVEKVVRALSNRGVAYSQSGEVEKAIADFTHVADLKSAPTEKVAQALLSRGFIHNQRGEMAKAITDYTAVVDLENVPVEILAQVLANRGVTYAHNGALEKAMADFTAIINLENAPVKEAARALLNRGTAYAQRGEVDKATSDYTAVVNLKDAPVEAVTQAFLYRGAGYNESREVERTLADYTSVINLEGAPVEAVAAALGSRGAIYVQRGEVEKATADYTSVIGLKGVSVEKLALSLYSRGAAYAHSGEVEKAVVDFTSVINLNGAPAREVAQAFGSRGTLYSHSGEIEKATADYTSIIDLAGAPVEMVAWALLDRGIAHARNGETQKEIADYTAVFNLEGAPIEIIARALGSRGVAYAYSGEVGKALTDLTTTINLDGAPVKEVAQALFNRGSVYLQIGEVEEALVDLEAVFRTEGAPIDLAVDAHIYSAEVLILAGRWTEAMRSVQKGLELSVSMTPPQTHDATDLVRAVFLATLHPDSRQQNVTELARLYINHHPVTALLGAGLVNHLGSVYRADALPSSDNLDQWLTTWEEASGDAEELSIPMRIFRTSVAFLKTGGKDQSVLLDLVESERSILQQALGIVEQ